MTGQTMPKPDKREATVHPVTAQGTADATTPLDAMMAETLRLHLGYRKMHDVLCSLKSNSRFRAIFDINHTAEELEQFRVTKRRRIIQCIREAAAEIGITLDERIFEEDTP